MRVLGIAGSLRKDSYNRLLLKNALELLPRNAFLEIYDLKDIPLYNQEIQDAGFTPAIIEFHNLIRESDCALMATPEYNYSVSGVLKNAIDWASRPYDRPPLLGKPAAIMGASSGGFGTVRAQLHLRQVLTALNMPTVAKPEIHIANAGTAFDEKGYLKDDSARNKLAQLINKLILLTERLSGNQE